MSARDRSRMRRVAALAARRGRRLWLVGGPVRDLLLGRAVTDVDLAIDGAVQQVGRAVARELGGRLVWHPRFSTAVISFDVGRLDLVRTRTETYAAPARLPRVRPAGIARDLARRDFSINAMALEIRPRSCGELLDPFAGRADLDAGRLRVLHEASFADDPTRVFRAARFATRFGFRVEQRTHSWLLDSVSRGEPCRLSGERVAAELRHVLREGRPAATMGLLARWELGASWGAPATPGPRGVERLRHAARRMKAIRLGDRERVALLFACAFHDLPRETRLNIADRLRVMRVERRLLVSGPERVDEILARLSRADGHAGRAAICRAANPPFLRLAALLARSDDYTRIRPFLENDGT
ncbi:MAG: hypothetical protein GTO33_03675 [Acidobacteria bacterium]|nr:hypothetical protein [Acidobacteriota bacterium]